VTLKVDVVMKEGAADFVKWTVNGYSDWYLPSIEELQPLHDNREEIGV
jgi:hypothetical protein